MNSLQRTVPGMVTRPLRGLAGSRILADPCVGCPLEARQPKVGPTVPPRPKIIAVGLAPGEVEERRKQLFRGPSGEMLREALAAAGLDPVQDVGYANLGRCRPEGDAHAVVTHGGVLKRDPFESPEWAEAERRCWSHLHRDLAGWTGPLLLLGARPIRRFLGESKASVARKRGLWYQREGRWLFAARHPASILRASEAEQARLTVEFHRDVARVAARVLGQETVLPIRSTLCPTWAHAVPVLRWLREHPGPWAVDIETYDAKVFPSRLGVAVDPCHPDFRVRALAIAWGPDVGACLELRDMDLRRADARAELAPVFSSPAEKWAFNGGFDEEGLVYPGWVSEVRNRSGDGMLALIALGDGRQGGHSLQRAVVDVLGEPYHWNGVEKSTMRDLPFSQVADGCLRDAAATFRLCAVLHARLARGEYL